MDLPRSVGQLRTPGRNTRTGSFALPSSSSCSDAAPLHCVTADPAPQSDTTVARTEVSMLTVTDITAVTVITVESGGVSIDDAIPRITWPVVSARFFRTRRSPAHETG